MINNLWELLKKPKIRDDKTKEFLNKLTDKEIEELNKKIELEISNSNYDITLPKVIDNLDIIYSLIQSDLMNK